MPLVSLLSRLRPVLEPGALGAVVAELTAWRLGGSRKRLFRLLAAADLVDLIPDPDFYAAACARTRLQTRRLLRHACAPPRTPGAAIALVGRLMTAGALNVYSSSACAEINRLLERWQPLELRRALLGAVIAELDSFAEVGAFLRGLIDSRACSLEPRAVDELLRAVLVDARSGDLAGDPGDLAAELPAEHRALVDACLGGSSSSEDDVDSDGNLAGFVVPEGEGEEGEESEEEEGSRRKTDSAVAPPQSVASPASSALSSSDGGPALQPAKRRGRRLRRHGGAGPASGGKRRRIGSLGSGTDASV